MARTTRLSPGSSFFFIRVIRAICGYILLIASASRGVSMAEVFPEEQNFWREAFSWRGVASARVLPTAIAFGVFATFIYFLYLYEYPNLAIEVGPHEVAG